METRPWTMPNTGPVWASARYVIDGLAKAGYEAVVVGGSVRDLLMGRQIDDVDIATDAHPDQVEAVFPHTVAVGKSFGVIVVVPPQGPDIEVATFRADGRYVNGRHPEDCVFADEVTDVKRRDFTFNALIADPIKGEIRDHVGGLVDLDNRVLRVVGDAEGRLTEDRLRVWRGCRFVATCKAEPEPGTLAALQRVEPKGLSRERIWAEWKKAFVSPERGVFVERAARWIGLHYFFGPEANNRRDFKPLIKAMASIADFDIALSLVMLSWNDDPQAWMPWIKGEPISKDRRRGLLSILTGVEEIRRLSQNGADEADLLALAHSPGGAAAAAVVHAMADLEPEALHTASMKAVTTRISHEATQEIPVIPLTAKDLMDMGVPQGPQVGLYLTRLRRAVFSREVITRKDAEGFVQRLLNESL